METTSKEKNNASILVRVQDAIQSGRIRVKPRWHFVLRATLGVVGGVIVLLMMVYTASFIIFILRATGLWFVPVFGSRGWYEFFRSAPWLLIVLCVVFIAVLEIMVRKYSFAYRAPLLYSAVTIVLIVVIGGVLIAATPLHRGFFRNAERDRLPFGGSIYRGFGLQRMSNVHVGAVREITTGGFSIENRRKEIVRVVFDQGVRQSLPSDLVVGDTVVVFGPRRMDTVRAWGVRKIESEFDPSLPMAPMPRHGP